MGTRSLTKFVDEYSGKHLVNMYRQFDGYPEGLGFELAEFLTGMTVVNGITVGQPERKANGMGCLAAQAIAHFKDGVGNVYLLPLEAHDVGEEYVYIVSCPDKTGPLNMRCTEVGWNDPDKVLFDGTPEKFIEWLNQEKEKVA